MQINVGERIGTNQHSHVLDRRSHSLGLNTQQAHPWLGLFLKRCSVGLRNQCIGSMLPHSLSIVKTHTPPHTAAFKVAQIVATGAYQVCQIPGIICYMQLFLVKSKGRLEEENLCLLKLIWMKTICFLP